MIFFLSSSALKDHSQTKWSRAQPGGKRTLSIRAWGAAKEPLIYPGTVTVPANHSGDSCMRETLFNHSVLSVLIQRIYFIILISLASVYVLMWRFRHSFYAIFVKVTGVWQKLAITPLSDVWKYMIDYNHARMKIKYISFDSHSRSYNMHKEIRIRKWRL